YEVVRMPNFEDLRPGDRIMLEGENEWLQVKATSGLCSVQGDVSVIVLDDYSLTIGYDGEPFEVDGVQPVYLLREGKDLMHSEYIPDEELALALKVRKKGTALYHELLRLKTKR